MSGRKHETVTIDTLIGQQYSSYPKWLVKSMLQTQEIMAQNMYSVMYSGHDPLWYAQYLAALDAARALRDG